MGIGCDFVAITGRVGIARFELPTAGFRAFPCPGGIVDVMDSGQLLDVVGAVVEAPGTTTRCPEPDFKASGLAGELRRRPGREVWAWVAWSETAGADPAGLVMLVRAVKGDLARWSIGWLVVNPAHRRRGIGMALVATAARFAGARGASVVHAETLETWPAAMAFWEATRLAALTPTASPRVGLQNTP